MFMKIYVLLLIRISFAVIILTSAAVYSFNNTEVGSEDEARIYDFTRCSGAGCPYTASWLIHTNLFAKVHWWTESTKMEAASFNVFDKAKYKFQITDPDTYFVHHMSMFEHWIHKKLGFEVAQNRTLEMSRAAMKGECDNLIVNSDRRYISLVPFYGGLPPNVTKDLSVKSIGQGNSLVSASTKALQCMATVCSCLKYFGRVVVATTRDEDYILIRDMLLSLPRAVRKHAYQVSFRLVKPAHLPFHSLAWAQHFVKAHNCPPPDASASDLSEYESTGQMPASFLNGKSLEYVESYRICSINVLKNHHGYPFDVTYHGKRQFFRKVDSSLLLSKRGVNTTSSEYLKTSSDTKVWSRVTGDSGSNDGPIRYVYYTECDQVVRFDSKTTLHALTTASNESTFFVGRRREKVITSAAAAYMAGLTHGRYCGARGYSLQWPKEKFVYHGD